MAELPKQRKGAVLMLFSFIATSKQLKKTSEPLDHPAQTDHHKPQSLRRKFVFKESAITFKAMKCSGF